jgi:hypothetical protein
MVYPTFRLASILFRELFMPLPSDTRKSSTNLTVQQHDAIQEAANERGVTFGAQLSEILRWWMIEREVEKTLKVQRAINRANKAAGIELVDLLG